MTNPQTKIWQALKGGVQDLINGYTVNWPQDQFSPPEVDSKPAPYIEVRHLPAGIASRLIASDAPQQYIGILQITLLWPAGEVGVNETVHPDNLIHRAGLLAQPFKTDLKLRFDDVAVRITENPAVAQPFRDGAYWRTPISINYSCFTT